MATQAWLRILDTAINNAVEDILPYPVIHGFDGDGWVWKWREYTWDRERVSEVHFRARPEPLGEGVETEISILAWMLQNRKLSYGRKQSGSYYTFEHIEHIFRSERERAILEDYLRFELLQSWEAVTSLVYRLEELEARREEAIRSLIENSDQDALVYG